MIKLALIIFCTLFYASPLLACPVCDSDTGQAVRAGVFGGDLGFNLIGVGIMRAGANDTSSSMPSPGAMGRAS